MFIIFTTNTQNHLRHDTNFYNPSMEMCHTVNSICIVVFNILQIIFANIWLKLTEAKGNNITFCCAQEPFTGCNLNLTKASYCSHEKC